MINSRTKGKVGELEVSSILKSHGYEARRGQQFHGGGDSPDVIGLPGFHLEVKRVEKGSLYDWMDQAAEDSKDTDKVPVVVHRRSRRDWVAILSLHDFLALVKDRK